PDKGDHLTLTASLAGDGPLPGWLHFDAETRLFYGTPANGDVGTIEVKLVATDTRLAWITDSFALTVANVNDAPRILLPIADAFAVIDQPFEFTLDPTTFQDTDPGDEVTLSATLAGGAPLPSWLHFDAQTTTFTALPGVEQLGGLSINVTARDTGGKSASDLFVLAVTRPNHAPTVNTDLLVDHQITQDVSFYFAFDAAAFQDSDQGDILHYAAVQLADGNPLPDWLTFDPVTHGFSGVAGNAMVGSLAIHLVARDGRGGVVGGDFNVQVVNVNDAPLLVHPSVDQEVEEGEAFSFSLPLDSFQDPDAGDSLELTATLANGSPLPGWLQFDAPTGTFFSTKAATNAGPQAIKLVATDGGGLRATDLFVMNVLPRNHAPTVAHALVDQQVAQDQIFFFTLPANTFADEDAHDHLKLNAVLKDGSALPAWLIFDAATGTFFAHPGNAQVGTLELRVTATDSRGATVSSDFALVVANVNDAPVVKTPIANQYADFGADFHFVVPANVFQDPDQDPLHYTATRIGGGALPEWLGFDAATGLFQSLRAPVDADAGTLNLRVTATDPSGASVATLFNLTVTHPNHVPEALRTIDRLEVNQDAEFLAVLPVGLFHDSDSEDKLVYSATLANGDPLPGWLHFDPVTQSLSGKAGNSFVGEWLVRVTASDPRGATASVDWQVVVANVNDAPTVALSLDEQHVQVDAPLSLITGTGHFADIDAGETLTSQVRLSGGA
ncbi:MAG: putative Ig domain-containing protein, partial [Magnetococcales bacterium]|nr:putative Ig domain-containing protein [Magnetococcales bacterium]